MSLFERPPRLGRQSGFNSAAVAARASNQGGITFDVQGNVPINEGYAVSTIPKKYSEFKTKRPINAEDVAEYAYQKQELLRGGGNRLGLWRDDASNTNYYDVSTVVGSKAVAKNLARQNKQFASYDLKRNQEIRY